MTETSVRMPAGNMPVALMFDGPSLGGFALSFRNPGNHRCSLYDNNDVITIM